MSIFNQITKEARKNPYKISIIINNKKLTYKELVKEVNLVSNYLSFIKIKPNDKIGIVENNTLEFVLIYLAVSNIGAQIVPLNTSYTSEMVYQNFINLKIKHLFIWHQYLKYSNFKKMNLKNIVTLGKKIKNFKYFNDYKKYTKNIKNFKNCLNNEFVITLTSGSTNNPKPIVLTQKTKLLRSFAARKLYKIEKSDLVLTASPLDHSLGQRLLLLPLLKGATSVILNTFTTFNFYEVIEKYKITFAILVANQIEELKKNKNKFKKINLKKGIVSASSKLSNNLKKILIKNGTKVFEMYGASEIGTVTNIMFNKKNKKYRSVGKSCSNAKIKILSENNKFQPPNKIGEIVCSTPLRFKKYLDMSKQTKNSFYKNYFKTGDIGYLDKDNYLYYKGRKKNIIKVSGINVYPEDIEKIIIKNKNIKEISALGIKDKTGKEKIIICMVLKNKKITKESIFDYCSKKLATFQQPHQIFFLNSLPKTSLGKINLFNLKKKIIQKL